MAYVYLLVAVLLGYGIAYLAHGRKLDRKHLEMALAEKKRELEDYQTHVAIYFDKTASLVESLQAQQENIIAHLCEGAQSLRPRALPGEMPPKDYWITAKES